MMSLTQEKTSVAQFTIGNLKLSVQVASLKKLSESVPISMLVIERGIDDRGFLFNRGMKRNIMSLQRGQYYQGAGSTAKSEDRREEINHVEKHVAWFCWVKEVGSAQIDSGIGQWKN